MALIIQKKDVHVRCLVISSMSNVIKFTALHVSSVRCRAHPSISQRKTNGVGSRNLACRLPHSSPRGSSRPFHAFKCLAFFISQGRLLGINYIDMSIYKQRLVPKSKVTCQSYPKKKKLAWCAVVYLIK